MPPITTRSLRHLAAWIALVAGAGSAWCAQEGGHQSVLLEELTSTEVQQRVSGGTTTVLIPLGGTEQNGPHMALGKHNVRARLLAQRIALTLQQALVAPVVAYVPQGRVTPPTGHMRYAGTISIPEPAFETMLEGAAHSFCQHGFRDVIFLSDHGGYRQSVARVVARLERSLRHHAQCRAHALNAYYDAAQMPFTNALVSTGVPPADVGLHAGLADTALTLALDPSLVRSSFLSPHGPKLSPADGVTGDPRRASPELGQLGVQLIVDASVAAIRNALKRSAAP